MAETGKTRESETDLIRPDKPGNPPRPATEPKGSEWSVRTDETKADPVTGAPNPKGLPLPPD